MSWAAEEGGSREKAPGWLGCKGRSCHGAALLVFRVRGAWEVLIPGVDGLESWGGKNHPAYLMGRLGSCCFFLGWRVLILGWGASPAYLLGRVDGGL